MKRCAKCGIEKPPEDFHRHGEGRQPSCKVCAIANRVEYYKQNKAHELAVRHAYIVSRRAWYVSLKQGRPCSDCGGVFHHSAMQWDHVSAEDKSLNVADLYRKSASKTAILVEIKKCELVCANCHALRTWNRRVAQSEERLLYTEDAAGSIPASPTNC